MATERMSFRPQVTTSLVGRGDKDPRGALLVYRFFGFLTALAATSQASVLSSSELESCVNDGSEDLECEMRIVVTASLEHGQGATESVQFLVSDVTNEDGDDILMEKPLRVSWSKTPAYWRYPLRYIQDVNYKPIEEYITVGFLSCSDNPKDATCGTHDVGGQPIDDSEGFCCGCGANDMVHGHDQRGNQDCQSFFPDETAHCLRFDRLWHSLFEVGPPQVFYDIIIAVAEPSNPDASWNNVTYTQTRLILNHQQPVAQANDGALRAELVGDFATATVPHSFESKYLAVPSRPMTHELVDETFPLTNAMLLSHSLFDLSGLTCDKIGVSFSAFKRQPEKCNVPVQTCLANQLEHFFQDDLAREAANQQPLYLVRGFCSGAVELGQSAQGGAMTYFLACPMEQRHTTMLRLDVKAKSAMFVTNVATGEIVSATAPSFEALQGGGRIDIAVVSTGRVVADFVLGVTNCSETYESSPAMTLSLKPYQSANLSFEIYGAQSSGGKQSCVAKLFDALGALLDQEVVDFSVTSLEQSTGAQGDVQVEGEEGIASFSTGGWTLMQMFIFFMVLVVASIVLCVCVRLGLVSALCGCLCKCLGYACCSSFSPPRVTRPAAKPMQIVVTAPACGQPPQPPAQMGDTLSFAPAAYPRVPAGLPRPDSGHQLEAPVRV